VVLPIIALGVVLTSAPGPKFTERDKAYYVDERTVNFVRPGLVVSIVSASIETDGTIRTRFRLADPRGLPLDREGITTPGNVAITFIAAYLPRNQTQYVAYTTRVQTSPITNVSATQAAGENNGVFERLAEGEYQYTFRVKAPAAIDRSATHTIGAYASRNLSEFDLGTQYDDVVFNFIPVGGTVTQVRDVVRTASCNNCHDPLALHGGPRRSVEVCALCHTPQTVDPDTGNTVDLPVMIHKIHMGSSLPSVQAGGKYVIIGNAQSVHDFSSVVIPSDARNCSVCHQPGSGAAQADALYKPNRAACGACHDNVNFATGEGHVDLPQLSDNQCSTCHIQQGELDFDASILGAHRIPRMSPSLPGTVFEMIRVDDGSAGRRPTVTFSIKDKSGKPILPSEMARLALVIAGPTSDYTGYVSEDARAAQGGNGEYYWTFQAPIPAGVKGSFTVGIEGYRNIVLLPGTRQETTVRDAGVNKVIHFSVDGSRIAARRTIVATEKCNVCHVSLSLHGDARNRVEQCVLCHNPNQTDAARRPASDQPAQSVDFRTMIHSIHSGEELGHEYTVYGFGGTKFDFSEVRYPGDRRNCDACHVSGSQQLPLDEGLLPVNNPRGWLTKPGPEAAACTACHGGRPTASHALGNTTALGESCATCHGPDADFAVSRVHAR
jgi:OmcA/MtrC family decaheme c-type cytochrome